MSANTGNKQQVAPAAPKPTPKAKGPAGFSGSQALNPERPPQLLGKYAKLLGKDLEKIVVTYTAAGVAVTVDGMPSTDFSDLKNSTLAQYQGLRKAENSPDDTERFNSFRNKYELRLNEEFPKKQWQDATVKSEDGEPIFDQTLSKFLEGINFKKRRALLMTQKQFASAYPNGFSQA